MLLRVVGFDDTPVYCILLGCMIQPGGLGDNGEGRGGMCVSGELWIG